MQSIQYSIISSGGESNITVFDPNSTMPLVAHSSHPNFQAIVAAVLAGEADGLADLFDTSKAVAQRFERLSERVTVANGVVFFDGDEVESALTKHIVRVLDESDTDDAWIGLVNFFEKVQSNPHPHSREQLYEWLDRHDFTITADGDIVAYKGVQAGGDGGYTSISSGRETVLVNDQPHTGRIPNPVGATIEMARSLVHHDPGVGCSVGLHVGTYEYASSFSRGTVLEVHVNPRDVVSVPTDCGHQKVRTCRYVVVDAIAAKHDVPFLGYYDDVEGDDAPTTFNVGERVVDNEGDEGNVVALNDDGSVGVDYDHYGVIEVSPSNLEPLA